MNKIPLPSGTFEGDFIHAAFFIVALSGSGIRRGIENRDDVDGVPVLLEDSGEGRDKGQTASGLHPSPEVWELKE